MSLNPLWPFFHRGEKQNASHYRAYCKGCVGHYMAEAKLRDLSDDSELDAVAKVVKEKNLFTAGALLISYCLNFLNQCTYISMYICRINQRREISIHWPHPWPWEAVCSRICRGDRRC